MTIKLATIRRRVTEMSVEMSSMRSTLKNADAITDLGSDTELAAALREMAELEEKMDALRRRLYDAQI